MNAGEKKNSLNATKNIHDAERLIPLRLFLNLGEALEALSVAVMWVCHLFEEGLNLLDFLVDKHRCLVKRVDDPVSFAD